MARMIDQIRASRLPSNMMQFAARGALQVPPAENIEILVHLARHNRVFGETARMTLAGWDEKVCLATVTDPATPEEVLGYFISPDNVRPRLLPALLENPSISETQLVKLAGSALRETLELMLKSTRVRSLRSVLETLRSSPYLKKEELGELDPMIEAAGRTSVETGDATSAQEAHDSAKNPEVAANPEAQSGATAETSASQPAAETDENQEMTVGIDDETVFSYLQDHATEIASEGNKPFQAIGGVMDLLLGDVHADEAEAQPAQTQANAASAAHPAAAGHHSPQAQKGPPKRENTLQKINSLDVKGRIQLALKGNKEERSILIRDGTKVVALAVLEAPKLSDGEVEKFASQKNVLEAVLRQIPLKRRFIKNYIVVRNLVANPRTPLDQSLGLMKNLLTQDLKNLSSNKEISETIRKLALKMYKQKLEAANKK